MKQMGNFPVYYNKGFKIHTEYGKADKQQLQTETY